MDLPVIIIGLIFILIISLPLYFVLKGKKIDKNTIDSLFAQYSQNNRYRFQLVATNNRKALGIDPKSKGLLFMDFNLNEPYVSFHNLEPIQRCVTATGNPEGRSNILKRVEWVFLAKNGTPLPESVLFHDAEKPYLVPVYPHE